MANKTQEGKLKHTCSFRVEETVKFKDASSEDVKKILDDIHKKHNHEGLFTGAVGLIITSKPNIEKGNVGFH